MNRLDFCKLMDQVKIASGIPVSEISFLMKMLMPTLRRFERGKHNFGLVKVMEYLNVLHAHLVIYNSNSIVYCTEYDQLITWMVNARAGRFSQRQLAEKISCAYLTIANIERGATVVSIDTFLKIVDVLGYELKIEKK